MMTQWVYGFGGGSADGDASMKNLLGGKGANLAEMSNLGLPVPPGFTITTEVCTYFYDHGKQYPAELTAAEAGVRVRVLEVAVLAGEQAPGQRVVDDPAAEPLPGQEAAYRDRHD